jgi:SAM-dependent methyltransferase
LDRHRASVSGEPSHPDVGYVASGYDAVYEGIPRSPTFERIWRAHSCGPDYPWEFGHISFLTVPEATRLGESLRLSAGDELVDLACGMGGPGLLIAHGTGAVLTGIDISTVALAEAAKRAERIGLEQRSSFVYGSFEHTGLAQSSFDAAMTIDALQYGPDKRAACREVARVLRPGGRFCFTAFEVDPAKVAGLPVLGTDPVLDYRVPLEAAGFEIRSYEETIGWRERLTSAYSGVLESAGALEDEMGEAAVSALQSELSLTLAIDPYPRRVLVVAVKTRGPR